ncbi:hypothetical protein GCM10009526_08570 [Glutamicibacter creatinolyticus]
MPSPHRKIVQRGAVAVASTALVVGGSVLAFPASATEAPIDTPAASSASEAAVDTSGLSKAIERDLKMTPEQYVAESEANVLAGELKKALDVAKIDATVVIEEGVVVVQVADVNLEAANGVIAKTQKTKDIEAVAEATAQSPKSTTSEPPEPVESDNDDKAAGASRTPSGPKRTNKPGPSVTATEQAEDKEKHENSGEKSVVLKSGIPSDPMETFAALKQNLDPSQFKRLTSVTKTAEGRIRIRAAEPAKTEQRRGARSLATAGSGTTLEGFDKAVPNVELVYGGDQPHAMPAATEDIYGGMGYLAFADGGPEPGVCSMGFNAWDKNGEDAIITAGHCSSDGALQLSAVVEHSAPGQIEDLGALLGTFGFNQFGLPNNQGVDRIDPVAEKWEQGTDIAVIEDINPELRLHPAVSKWPAGKDERDETLAITDSGTASIGAKACSVGRTTGWSCSRILEEGIFLVGGIEDKDARARPVTGYIAENPNFSVVNQGDSGGAVIVGTRAVGINSANQAGEDGKEFTDDELAMYTSLADASAKTPVKNYEIKLFVNAPKVTSPRNGSEIEPGSTISGTVAKPGPNANVEVLVDGEVIDTVKVTRGSFSFKAPQTEGKFAFELRAKSGKFNESELTPGNYTLVAPEPSEQPTPTEEPTESPSESDEATQSPSPSQSLTKDSSEEPTKSESPKQTEQPEKDPLADTGSTSMPVLAIAGGLGLTGALLLLLRRSKRRHG